MWWEAKEMICPYRWYNKNLKKWICSIANQYCPEATLEGFKFEECMTYKEEEGLSEDDYYNDNWVEI